MAVQRDTPTIVPLRPWPAALTDEALVTWQMRMIGKGRDAMAMQLDEVREVITVGGRTLEIIDLARRRAERAEAAEQAQTVTATNWQARAIRAEEGRREAVEKAKFWHGQEGQRTVQLRQAERLAWLCVALAFLVLALAGALFVVAMVGA